MLLRLQNPNPSSSYHLHTILSSSLSYSSKPLSSLTLPRSQVPCFHPLSVTCKASRTRTSTRRRTHETAAAGGFKRGGRPVEKWIAICKRISSMPNPELGGGSATVLNQWENEGKSFTKLELCRVIKELRKFKRHKRALEVYDWMNNRPERFRITSSDAAIQLDLVAKVHSISSAEEFFERLNKKLKNRMTHGALLNVYVHSRLKEKAESIFNTMKSKGYAVQSLTFNGMMTLYMNLKDYDKVAMLVSEMIKSNIQLDVYSYNIWLSSCGSRGLIEKMEQVFEQMAADPAVVPNCATFSTMATTYIKMRLLQKAEECIRKVESKIEGRDRMPLHYLLSLYGSVGKKDDVYRVWNTYKLNFPNIPNLGYHAVISSLVRMDDIEGAETLYKEWLSVKSSYDPRIGNLFIGWYVRKGDTDKALRFFKKMTEDGGTPNPSSWEVLSEGHIADKRISEALSCLKEAFMANGSKSWKPRPINLSSFLKLCWEQDDVASAEALVGLLRQSEFIKDEVYASLIGLSDGTFGKVDTADITDDINDSFRTDNNDDVSQMLISQLESVE